MMTQRVNRSGLGRRFARWLTAGSLAVGLAVLAPAAPAAAHNQLIESDPPAGASLTTAPETVELVFVEPLREEYTTVVVTGADGTTVTATELAVDHTRATVTFLEPLPDGEYTVGFRVVSLDGHPVQGSVEFTVAAGDGDTDTPPSSAPSAGEDTAAADATDSTGAAAGSDTGADGGGNPALLVVGAGALLVAGGVGVGYALIRRRRAG